MSFDPAETQAERRRTYDDDIAEIKRRLDGGSARMDKLETAIATNTSMTAEVLEAIQAAKAGFRALGWLGTGVRWLGGIAAAGVAIYAAAYALLHGGVPPK